MTNTNNLPKQVYTAPLTSRMLIGAGIALTLIVIFLWGAPKWNPDWPKFWIIRPLVVVPFAGAMGGLFYHLMDNLRYGGGWRKFLANFLSLLVYIIGLWLGTVLGLAGTMWH